MRRWRVEWKAAGELVFDLPEEDVSGCEYNSWTIAADVDNALGGLKDVVADMVFAELDGDTLDNADVEGEFEFELRELAL